jgi:hypothetical protein
MMENYKMGEPNVYETSNNQDIELQPNNTNQLVLSKGHDKLQRLLTTYGVPCEGDHSSHKI